MVIGAEVVGHCAKTQGRGVWVPAFAGTTSRWIASQGVADPLARNDVSRDDESSLPDGQISLPIPSADLCLSSPVAKNISLRASPKSNLELPPSRPTEGRLAIVTDAGRDAVDADALIDERR